MEREAKTQDPCQLQTSYHPDKLDFYEAAERRANSQGLNMQEVMAPDTRNLLDIRRYRQSQGRSGLPPDCTNADRSAVVTWEIASVRFLKQQRLGLSLCNNMLYYSLRY